MISPIGSSSMAQQMMYTSQNSATKNNATKSPVSEEATESAAEKAAEAKGGGYSSGKIDMYA